MLVWRGLILFWAEGEVGGALTEGESFGDLGNVDLVDTVEVGNGLGNFDGFEIGASGEVEGV